jgi:hypothetical protein
MYVVKVGEYYVKKIKVFCGTFGDIELSKEIMGAFTEELAEKLAKKTNGEVIEISAEVTNE